MTMESRQAQDRCFAGVCWLRPPVLASLLVAMSVPVSSGTHEQLVTLAGTAAWLIVLVSPAWNHNERGWHDKAAGTIVINDPHPRPHRREQRPR